MYTDIFHIHIVRRQSDQHMIIRKEAFMSEENLLDQDYPNFKKYVSIPLVLAGLLLLIAGIWYLVDGLPLVSSIARILGGFSLIATGIGFWYKAKWARVVVGIGFILLGLYLAIWPIVHVIAAGTVGFQKYDPFAEFPPLVMVLIVFAGLTIALVGGGIVITAFIKKSVPSMPETKACPYCGVNVLTKNFEHHVTDKCPKRMTITK